MRQTLLVALVLVGCRGGRLPGQRIIDPQICNASCEPGFACDGQGECRPICSSDAHCRACDRCDAGLCAPHQCDEAAPDDTTIPSSETPAVDDNASTIAAPSTIVPVPTRTRMQGDGVVVEAGVQAWIGESASARFRIAPRQ